jgi:hypothetical protein
VQVVARVDCWRWKSLCTTYGIKGYPNMMVGTPEQWAVGPSSGQLAIKTALQLNGTALSSADKISEGLMRCAPEDKGPSKGAGPRLLTAAPAGSAGGPDTGRACRLTGASVALPAKADFYAKLAVEIRSRPELMAMALDGKDSWKTATANSADVELALVITAQNMLARLATKSDTTRPTDRDQRQATEVATVFLNMGPAYAEAGNELLAYVGDPRRMLTTAEHPNVFLERCAVGCGHASLLRDFDTSHSHSYLGGCVTLRTPTQVRAVLKISRAPLDGSRSVDRSTTTSATGRAASGCTASSVATPAGSGSCCTRSWRARARTPARAIRSCVCGRSSGATSSARCQSLILVLYGGMYESCMRE